MSYITRAQLNNYHRDFSIANKRIELTPAIQAEEEPDKREAMLAALVDQHAVTDVQSTLDELPHLGGRDDVRTYLRKAERAAALIYAHFRKEFGFPIVGDALSNNSQIWHNK